MPCSARLPPAPACSRRKQYWRRSSRITRIRSPIWSKARRRLARSRPSRSTRPYTPRHMGPSTALAFSRTSTPKIGLSVSRLPKAPSSPPSRGERTARRSTAPPRRLHTAGWWAIGAAAWSTRRATELSIGSRGSTNRSTSTIRLRGSQISRHPFPTRWWRSASRNFSSR